MITDKQFGKWIIVVGIFSSSMFVLGFWAGNKHCKEINNYCPAPRVEKVEVPVGDLEVLSKFLDCRRDLIEVSEAFNSSINCHNKMCE